jgi:hypothetical protein
MYSIHTHTHTHTHHPNTSHFNLGSIQDESLKGDYSKVRPGDCIVAFSKFDIFSIKREIENLTEYKCCVVYGKVRVPQALLCTAVFDVLMSFLL